VSPVICETTLSTARCKKRARFLVQIATVINGAAAVAELEIGSLPVTMPSLFCYLDFSGCERVFASMQAMRRSKTKVFSAAFQ
jgi:hypothetical protein